MDEAQRGREEEGGGSVGGQDPYKVPGAGGELRRGGRRRLPGTGRPRGRCPPRRVSEGGVSLPPPVDSRGPVDDDGSNGGNKK